ncbi:hypothetical protein O181_029905 [Austropuccinia psidii MF-1]|uniref:Uncharacterized protein n=1 Tax=Austropuccinia psidii MF-1 TaxID=1389203 RepID=A0A9Q3CW48_9BASI|nr:hypothetical protein [Austropuccinia psidii MF-1]
MPLETQSQGSTHVISAEPESSKGKGKRHSENLITAKKCTSIATKRSRKPQTSESIQGKQTLITCTGKITIINPVLTSKGKFPKAVDNKLVQGTVKENRDSLSKARRPGRGHLGHSGGWKDTERNHTHSSIHLPIQHRPQARGLEGYRSISSALPTPQISLPMENGQQ